MIGSGVGEFAIGGFYPARASSSIADPLPGLVSDPLQAREFLLRSTPSAQTVDLSSSGYASLPTDTPYKLFPSAISRPYNFSVELPLSLSAGTAPLSGGASLGIGEVLVKNSDGSLDSVALLDWLAEDVDLYIGRKEASISDFTRFCKGISAGVSWDLNGISILHKDQRFKLQKRLQPNLYMGTGSCLRFDGSGDYVDYGDILDRGATDSFTIEALFRSSTLNLSRALFSKKANVGTPSGWALNFNASNNIFARVADGTTEVLASFAGGSVYLDGRWHRASMVVDRTTQTIRLYIDGVLLNTSASISAVGSLANSDFIRAGIIGGAFVWSGDLDDFRFWSFARTQSQIQADMFREVPAQTGLEINSRYNESSGTSAGDSSGNGRTGTITGAAWIGSLEGDSSVAGTPKPILLGIKRQISPKLVDPQRLVYQWHDGFGQALDSVEDGGDPYTFGSILSNIYASTPAAGSYNVMLSANGSYFRLGSNPIGVITCTARGDSGGSLGYRDDLAGIHQKTATQFGGMSDSDLNLDTYSALSLSATATIGFYFDSEINVDAALDEISKKGGSGWWAGDRVGRISVGRIVAPETLTPDVYVTADDLVDPSKGGTYKRNPIGVRVGKVVLGYRRYNTQLTSDQVAGTVDLATRNDLKQEYRYVTATDPNASSDADTMTVYTEFDDEAEALAEAYRLLDIWKVDRGTYRVTMDRGLLSYFIGTVFHVTVNRYDTAAGKTFVVYGLSEDMGQYGATDRLEPALFG